MGDSMNDAGTQATRQVALNLLVLKFEGLLSSPKELDGGGKETRALYGIQTLKELGQRPSLGVRERITRPHEDDSTKYSLKTFPIRWTGTAVASSRKLVPLTDSHRDVGSKSRTVPIVRGENEECPWRGNSQVKTGDVKILISELAQVITNTEADIKPQFQSGPELPRSRQESFVQKRIRLLEQEQMAQQKYQSAGLKRHNFNKAKIVESEFAKTPVVINADESSGGNKGRDRERQQQSCIQSISNFPKHSTLKEAVINNCGQSPSSQKPLSVVKELTKAYLEKVSRADLDSKSVLLQPPSPKICIGNEFSCKNLAPTIQERILLFELYRGNKRDDIATQICTRTPEPIGRCKNKDSTRSSEPYGEILERTKEVAEEKTAVQLKKTMNRFSKCLAERKRSSTGGKYESELAHRKKATGKSTSISCADTIASRGTESTTPYHKLFVPAHLRPLSMPNNATTQHILRKFVEKQPNLSSLPISWSAWSRYRPKSLSDTTYNRYQVSSIAHVARSLPELSAYTIIYPAAPEDTLLRLMNRRVAEITAIADGGDQSAIAHCAVEGFIGVGNVWNVGDGAWVESESSEDEDRTLVVQSVVPLSEPKPLRITEVGRMLSMCRLGSLQSREPRKVEMGDEKEKERQMVKASLDI